MVMHRWLALYLLAFLPSMGFAQDTTRIGVEITQNGIRVAGEAEVRASRAVAWETLTDYESWVRFMPDLQLSQIVSRAPLRIAQRGALPWLPGIPMVVLAEVVEMPRERVSFSKIQGNLLFLEGEWRISGKDGALRLSYLAEIIPGLPLPANLSVEAVTGAPRAQGAAMAREILRRGRERLQK
jgi:hypothetical protein